MVDTKLFPSSYAEYYASNRAVSAQSTSKTEVLTPETMIQRVEARNKEAAVRQSFIRLQSSFASILNQNATLNVVTELLPSNVIGTREFLPSIAGTVAYIAGGVRGLWEAGGWGAGARYSRAITRFSYLSELYSPSGMVLTERSRYAFTSSANQVSAYWFGGYSGVLGQYDIGGTHTIDRTNFISRSTSRITTKLTQAYSGYVATSFGNINKAFIAGGYRVFHLPATWGESDAPSTGVRRWSYGWNGIERFTYAGELASIISATLAQPRYGLNALFNGVNAYTLFGLNESGWSGGGWTYFHDATLSQGTKFNTTAETSSAFAETLGLGGSRYESTFSGSQTDGFLFGGLDYATYNSVQSPNNLYYRNTIFRLSYGTETSSEIAERFSTPEWIGAASHSNTGCYLHTGWIGLLGEHLTSYFFNFTTRTFTPLVSKLMPRGEIFEWGRAQADYSPGWGV